MKRYLSMLLVMAITFALAACAGGNSDGQAQNEAGGSKAEAKPTTLKIMMFQNKPNDLDKVLEEFYARTKDTLNVKLDIEWTPGIMDLKEKVRMKMSAGEEYDLVWDAPSSNMKTLVPQGAYVPLDEYFNNDQYPGLKKAFSETFLDSNKMNGHLYGVPLVSDWGMPVDGTYVRKDLREKYAPDGLHSEEDFLKFLDAIVANEPDLLPYATDGNVGFRQFPEDTNPDLLPINSRIYGYGIGGYNFYFRLNESRTELATPVVPLGAPEEDFAVFGEWSDPDVFYESYNKYVKWNKYLETDVLTQKDKNSLFYAGKAAAVAGDLGIYTTYVNQMAERGYEVEWFSKFDAIRKQQPGAIETDYVSRNFVCVPVTSKKVDKVMEFLNWIFEDRANHDLFEFGIEDVHWEAVGDTKYKLPEGIDASLNYNFPGYELTWNPNYIRYLDGTPEEIIAIREYGLREDSYVKSPLAGFVFNTEPLKTEIAQISSKGKEMEAPLLNGIYENPRAEWENAYKTLKDIGLEKVRTELEKQLKAFFEAKQ